MQVEIHMCQTSVTKGSFYINIHVTLCYRVPLKKYNIDLM